jgi:hypothetical protein
MKFSILIIFLFGTAVGASAAQDSLAVNLKITHTVTCPKSGSITKEATATIFIKQQPDGSSAGETSRLLQINACDLTFWLNMEVRKDVSEKDFTIVTSQTLSTDGNSGFDVSMVYCKTSDISRIPFCAGSSMPTIDPLKLFLQTGYSIDSVK